MEHPIKGSWVSEEISGLTLPDKRFSNNIISITECLAQGIGKSFSGACGEALRKSAWRLFSRAELSLLDVHQQKTLARCAAEDTILIAEDTTDISYIQKGKQGMGLLGGSKKMDIRGLNMHTAMALTTEGAALGIIHQKIWAPFSGRAANELRHLPIEEKESFKWIAALRAINSRWEQSPSAARQTVILIGDREADFFEHYAQPRQSGVELLVRVKQLERRILYKGASLKISELLPQLSPLGCGTIKVWRRSEQKERTARVTYYCASLRLPPTYRQTLPEQEMHLVYVREHGRGKKDGIEWLLLSSLPVNSLEEAVRAATYYSRRWVIERFHLILKSGLRIEQLQMDNFTRLHNALQLYALVGWHLLWLCRLGHSVPDALAELHFDREAIEVMSAVSGKQRRAVRDFVVEVGRLGGFILLKSSRFPAKRHFGLA